MSLNMKVLLVVAALLLTFNQASLKRMPTRLRFLALQPFPVFL